MRTLPDKHIVEMVELKDHPWFVASQAHPEFKSRPTKPHPLFSGLIGAALDYRKQIRLQKVKAVKTLVLQPFYCF